ncbi:Crp/Fnr family transcriptional regulator [Gelidibacter salicanalis]|uniref:Crp/Fnr family transcriptional regulator n=1 Tax=Gelidibacter salicanalis TaxID=291193 RepID=A0A934KX04_9FLAO|nr:Crp/Fnr family transcriptional regulator [Gelidibacter salicanalis]MBJ7882851.1 Crp/Fnr family transcriptional regulator [Gelidibacter salicanalis]
MKNQLSHHINSVVSISDQEMNEFLSLFSEQSLKRKSYLIQPQDTVTKEYYVLSGCLIAYYVDVHGEKHILQFAIEDWWISDFEAFFNNQLAKLYVEAIEDSVVLAIEKSMLEVAYSRIPKLERFFRIKTTAAFVSAHKRILTTLEKSATQRYLDFCLLYPNITTRINDYHVANYLGIKPESLSRIKKALEVAP